MPPANSLRPLYLPLDPRLEDWLDVGQGHQIRYEEAGNPAGLPVVFLHGGPGSACQPGHRRFFDPAAWRIVLFDQRGCGRSTPRGSVRANTTAHLVSDLERLRKALGIDRWVLFGGSWGATLALAYAAAHRERVLGMILRGVFLGSRREVQWFTGGLRAFLPEAWARFAEASGTHSPQAVVDDYRRRIASRSRDERFAAAAAWREWESAVMAATGSGSGSGSATARAAPDDALVDRTRVHLHYLANDCFLAPGELLRAARRLAGVPGIIVQGRLDLVCPPSTAHALACAWPGAELESVEQAGHDAFDLRITDALVRAADRLRLHREP